MPAGDRTGPVGLGSGTGRRFGFCAGFDQPGYYRDGSGGFGRGVGYGRGFGRGRGFRSGWGYSIPDRSAYHPSWPIIDREEEIRMLKSQIESLEQSRRMIEKRLVELRKE